MAESTQTHPIRTPEEYLEALPADRKQALSQLRETLLANLPSGFAEVMSSGMISYVVPHTLFPNGYHCDPSQPLPFMSIASQKNFVAVYHMGLYADQELLAWFTAEHQKQTTQKLDMGKSCIRFKKLGQIPYALIGDLAARITPQQWVATYERVLRK